MDIDFSIRALKLSANQAMVISSLAGMASSRPQATTRASIFSSTRHPGPAPRPASAISASKTTAIPACPRPEPRSQQGIRQ
ncbi:hypothetical protein EYF80_043639 [Liparis tanakae]|uniref:Uncharacterized protein n=1 Tax=Liparis tanakae TaxID=230148 RepID=A0A4Z2G0X6_9TELE|nr:hypothetical protein EYF80_043639 [Liparis tanakae]